MTVSPGWVAVALAALAGAVLPPYPTGRLRPPADGGAVGAPPRPRRTGPVAAGAAALVVGLAGRSVLLAAAAGVAAGTACNAIGAAVLDRRVAAGRTAALDLVIGLVSELRGGQQPRAALEAAALAAGIVEVAAAARSPTVEPAGVLDRAAGRPGGELLADLAATWRAVEVTGAGLAAPAARLAAAARADEGVRRELAAQLAGPRSTMHLLCVLPVVGVLLGHALGALPAGFLLRTAPGQAALLAGIALEAAGVAWTRAIVSRASGR
jgi:tight adherence protein B